jgi:hypothetical protein
MARREIPRWWLDSVLDRPEQRLREPEGIEVLQTRYTSEHGRISRLRAVIAAIKHPPVVVTGVPHEQD